MFKKKTGKRLAPSSGTSKAQAISEVPEAAAPATGQNAPNAELTADEIVAEVTGQAPSSPTDTAKHASENSEKAAKKTAESSSGASPASETQAGASSAPNAKPPKQEKTAVAAAPVAGAGRKSRKRWIPLWIVIALIVIAVAVFFISCAIAANRTTILPGASIAGVSVSGFTEEEAIQEVEDALAQRYAEKEITLSVPALGVKKPLAVAETIPSMDLASAAHSAYLRGRTDSFLEGGLQFLHSLVAPEDFPLSISRENDKYLRQFLSEVAQQIDDPVVEHTYRTEEDQLVVTMGHDGAALDQDVIYDDLLAHLESEDYSDLTCTLEQTTPAPLDWDAIYDDVYVPVANAEINKETYQITKQVVGVQFDKDTAKKAAEGIAPDESFSVPLIYTEPEVTAADLAADLCSDLLSTCTTTVGGSANRASNVKLAASFADGTILLPGDVFSYNGVVGSRQASRGFLPAPAYVAGQTVNEIGGGICQLSSTIYLASMRANLEIVERHNHSYAVGYVPDGMDATVYYGSLDFQFKNNRETPIRVACSMENRTLTVQIFGIKGDSECTAEITNKILSVHPFSTVYQKDPSIQSGSKVKTTGYTGKTVETYRSLYDADGNLISTTLEATSRYRTRNKVVLIPAA